MILGIQKVKYLVLISVLLYSVSGFSQRLKFLKNNWKVYDQKSTLFFPYIVGNDSKLPLHLTLDASIYKGLYLSIISKKEVSLYVENCFATSINRNATRLIPIDSLSKIHGNTLLCSFYGEYNQVLIDSISIVTNNSHLTITESNLSSVPKIRFSNFSRNYFTLLLLLSIGLLAGIRSVYSKIFDQYVSLVGSIYDTQPSSNSKNSFESYNFVFVFLAILFYALSCISLSVFDRSQDINKFYEFLGGVISLMITISVFYLLKFFTTYFASWLFSINKFAIPHFLIFVRISVLWSIALLILSMLEYSEISWIKSTILSLFFFVSLFFLTLISLKVSLLINRVTKISRLYLISYLCITEWLPYFVILKLYMIYFY